MTMTNPNQEPPPYWQQEQYLEKPLPSSEESERVILGAILLDNNLINEAIEKNINPSTFYSSRNKRIYEAMLSLYNKDSRIDAILIGEELKKDGQIDSIGGIAAITNLTVGLPHFSEIEEYARIIKEKALGRHIIKTTNHTVSEILAEDEEVSDIIDRLEDSIYSFTDIAKTETFQLTLKNAFDEMIAQYKKNKEFDRAFEGLSTGYYDLDYYLSGLKKDNFIIIGGRPSMGKTALALNIMQNLPESNEDYIETDEITVLIFTLEMSKDELKHRLLVTEARVNSQRLKMWNLSDSEKNRVYAAQEKLKKYRFVIDDTPGINTNYIKAKTKRVEKAQKKKISLIIVDYLQLVESIKETGSRQQDLTKISRQLKLTSRIFQCPVIALSQLSRDPETRVSTNFRPILKDLRESGAIEQDADVVILVYREDYYKSHEDDEDTNITELIIAKQRNGPVGTVKLHFTKEFTRFSNLTEDQLPTSYDGEF